MPHTQQYIWRAEHVTVWLPNERQLACPVDVVLMPGKVTQLEGPSGVGKSTILRCLFAPTTASWHGLRWRHEAQDLPKNHTMLIQQSPMLDWLSPKENAIAPMETLNLVWPDKVQHLSGGQRQKVAWMRAMANQPDILILDEPLAGLDIETKNVLTQSLCDYLDAGNSALLVSHDKNLLTALGKRRHVIEVRPPQTQTTAPQTAPKWMHLVKLCQAMVPLYPTRMDRLWQKKLWKTLLGQALHLRYAGFFLGTGLMLGASLTLVLVRLGSAWFSPEHAITHFALKPVEWLAAPLAAILTATTVGNAIGAWLGNQTLRHVPVTLEGLGSNPHIALWRPAFFACWLGAQVHQLTFILGMWLGGWCVAMTMGLVFVDMGQLVDVVTQRHVLSCVITYPICVALVTLWRSSHVVREARALTTSMIRITTWSTLLIIALEFFRAWFQSL